MSAPAHARTSTSPPIAYSDQLRPYQRAGAGFLIQSKSALLADEMGLGKTVQVISAARLLVLTGAINRMLVVAPRSLRTNWLREFAVWAPELLVMQGAGTAANRSAMYYLPLPVLIVTYDQIRQDSRELDGCPPYDLVVLDEAQRIKDAASQTSIACRGIPRVRSWALTGTPVENSADDLVSIFAFVRRNLISPRMPWSDIRPRIKPHFLRRTKEAVLPALPPIIVQDLICEMAGRQRQAYRKLWNSRHQILPPSCSRPHMFSFITKLKQLCNQDPHSGESVKYEALDIVLQNLSSPSDKVIVFSQYVATLRWLSTQLRDLNHRTFSGDQDDADREAVLHWFRACSGPAVLFMSLRAGGVGLNLQEASMVVLFDRWWNPAVEQQAVQRAHRFGRSRPLHVLRFLVSDSIEQRIDQVLRRKSAVFTHYVERAESASAPSIDGTHLRQILALAGATAGH